MTRARELARLANENVFTAEDYNSPVQVGINSTDPTSTLDVRGELKVGTAIQAGTAGVVTATEFSGSIGTFSGAGSFGGNLDVTGNVTIGGTLTYEDVTNIDVIGIVTAQNGVNISGGQLLVGSGVTIGNAGVATFSGTSDIHLRDNVQLNVGDGSDHALFHNGSSTRLEGTVPLYIKGSNIVLYKGGGTNKFAEFTGDSGAYLFYNASKKWETTNDGTVTTGIATATGLDVADKITHTGDANTAIRFPSADTISLETAGSERARVTSDGEFLVGTTTDNGFKFKVSDGGASEFAFAPNDSGLNSLVNYDRVGSAYTGFKLTATEQRFWTGTSPSERLRIASDGNIDVKGGNIDFEQQNNSTNTANGSILFSNSSTETTSRIAGFTGGSNDDGDIRFYTKNSGTETEALRISQHSTPKLQFLAGECEIVPSATDGSLLFRADPGQNRSNSNIAFEVDATERARFDADGKLGINTTNTGGGYLGAAVNSSSTNVLATGAIALNLKNLNTTDNTWVSMDFNNSVGGIVARFGAQFKDTSDKSTDLYFATREDGGALAERLRISSDAGVELTGHSECNINALGNSSGTVTIDFTTANYISCTLTGTTTFANPTTESVGQSGSIIITQDGTGSRTASWGSQFKWVGGTAPTLTTTAAAVDRIDYLVVAADTIHAVASVDVK